LPDINSLDDICEITEDLLLDDLNNVEKNSREDVEGFDLKELDVSLTTEIGEE